MATHPDNQVSIINHPVSGLPADTGRKPVRNRQLSRLVNLNRFLILALTLASLLLDGLQAPDLPCAFALLVWLWLPQCTRIEIDLLKRVDSMRRRLASARDGFLRVLSPRGRSGSFRRP